MVMCDEVPDNLPVKVIDVSDVTDLTVKSYFKSNEGATAHNPFVVGNSHVVLAYYEDGVQIYDISNPENPVRTGFFDTHPQNGNTYEPGNAYNGCWGAFPYFPSKTLIASDRQNGLFVMNAEQAIGIEKNQVKNFSFKIYPNPAADYLYIYIPDDAAGNYSLICSDVAGKAVFEKNLNLQPGSGNRIELEQVLASGVYYISLKGEKTFRTERLLKITR
jgi:hypothetical protein